MPSYVVGADLGGTRTRVLVAEFDGDGIHVVGRAETGGGNPVSLPDTAAHNLCTALREALAGVDPTGVRAGVVGMAGAGALRSATVRKTFESAWTDTGMPLVVSWRGDLEIAYVAGAAEPDGTVLIAGTGANAGQVRGFDLVRSSDGHGWLLGDDGSGYWLGREGVRATLRQLDTAQLDGVLSTAVLQQGLPDGEPVPGPGPLQPELAVRLRELLIGALNVPPYVRLAGFAPLVADAAASGDEYARAIVTRAAELLIDTVGRVRSAEESGPLVLAGGVAADGSEVGRRVIALAGERFAGTVAHAGSGAGAAAWLALQSTGHADSAAHRFLTTG